MKKRHAISLDAVVETTMANVMLIRGSSSGATEAPTKEVGIPVLLDGPLPPVSDLAPTVEAYTRLLEGLVLSANRERLKA